MARAEIAVTLNWTPFIEALEILKRHTEACIADLRALGADAAAGEPPPGRDLDDDPSSAR